MVARDPLLFPVYPQSHFSFTELDHPDAAVAAKEHRLLLSEPKAITGCLRFLTVCIPASGKTDMVRAWVAIQTQARLASLPGPGCRAARLFKGSG